MSARPIGPSTTTPQVFCLATLFNKVHVAKLSDNPFAGITKKLVGGMLCFQRCSRIDAGAW